MKHLIILIIYSVLILTAQCFLPSSPDSADPNIPYPPVNTPFDSTMDCPSGPVDCPEGFIPVEANPEMGTYCDFCVSKYEMKIVGEDNGDQQYDPAFEAESRASGTPWKNMSMEEAKAECEALGEGYHLITNPEWMTIARDIESVAANWSDNQIHPDDETDAMLNVGHSCRQGTLGVDCRVDSVPYSGEALAASIDDSDGCYGYVVGDNENETPQLNENGWHLYRRTHFLSNGEVIWDFSGNVWNWIDWYVPLAEDRARVNGEVNNDYLEINDAEPVSAEMVALDYKSRNTSMTRPINAHGLGRYHPTELDYNAGTAMRGGNYMHGQYDNGIYALGMGYGPDPEHITCRVGFRCVYRPWEIE